MRFCKIFKRKYFGYIFYVLVILFFAVYLQGVEWERISKIDFQIGYLILAVPISLACRALCPIGWLLLIRQLGEHVECYCKLNYVYAKAWLGRYIPGKVAWVAGKVYFASRQGMNKAVLATTSIIEAGIQVATALIMAFLLLYLSGKSGQIDGAIRLFACVSLVAIAVAITPAVFNSVTRTVYRIVLKEEMDRRFYFRLFPLLRVGSVYAFIHAVGAVAYFLIVKAVDPSVTLEILPFLGAAYLFAGALGTLAVFAPSGIGVREGVQAVLLAQILPKETIVVVLVLARVWSAVMDVCFYFISGAVVSWKRRVSVRRDTEEQLNRSASDPFTF